MDFSFFYTDPITGKIDEEKKKYHEKLSKSFVDKMKRHRRRVNLVTEKLNPPSYFSTDVHLLNMKDVPVCLYEPHLPNRVSSINLLDYILITLEQLTDIKYSYKEWKKAIGEYVKIFNIKPLPIESVTLPDGRKIRSTYEDENGNFYEGKDLWFYLCRRILKQEKIYHRKQTIKKLNNENN